jgi:HAD superfamily hydrolase (TIGR01509 family)
MRMPAPAAILDIDGTLVDTNYQHALAWNEAFVQSGFILPIWKIHRLIGMGGDQLVAELIGKDADEEHGDTLRAAESVLYMASIASVHPLEEARELIETLSQGDRKCCLASSAKAHEVDHYLDLLDARELVDSWTTSGDVENTKPEPDLVRAALDKLGTDDAVMVGDTPWDVKAAKGAGVDTIAVLTGGFSRTELEEAGAVQVYESIVELRADLQNTPLAG